MHCTKMPEWGEKSGLRLGWKGAARVELVRAGAEGTGQLQGETVASMLRVADAAHVEPLHELACTALSAGRDPPLLPAQGVITT